MKKIENAELLYEAVLSLETKKECEKFFEDIFTVTELIEISQRLEVAKMLKNQCVYSDIVAKTGASTATISRVNRCLNYGADGYKIVLDRISKDE